ncbi:hypothetical protein [Streptomyces uncialis]|uniref:hypothetical protein n=1 Tax=Streptomyces uncialis TaxID=1048205 RepID=UPI0022565CB9|nr:hypothetical protein [Streptomyces uncialis]MCX4665049.1 hypothetical protein [Streptomyces uncialis]
MNSEDFSSSTFEVAREAPDEVVLRRGIVHTQGLQPEDLGVLSALLLRDPALPATLGAIRADLVSMGWKMGKDRFTAVVARLKSVGHIAHVPAYNEETQRPTWVTRVYRNPANNRQYVDLGIAESSQVRGEMRETRNPADEPSPEGRETRIPPGQSRNAGNPPSEAESRETRNPANDVSAGQSRNAENPPSGSPPPHPPEEEDSSSPYPLTRPTGSLPSQQQEERAPEFSADDLAAAANFLQRMQLWQAGRATARRCAPRLLRAMRVQGWPPLASMDGEQRAVLEADIFKNTGGATSWVKCLPGWVDDLCLYRKPARAAAPSGGPAPQDVAALRAACPDCDQYGWALDDDDDKPNRRCTHPGLAAASTETPGEQQ